MIPVTLFILFVIWLSATIIAAAATTGQQGQADGSAEAASNISGIRAWYFEAAQLAGHPRGLGLLNTKITKLHTDNHTDPMTGLFNRRAMQQMLDDYQAQARPGRHRPRHRSLPRPSTTAWATTSGTPSSSPWRP